MVARICTRDFDSWKLWKIDIIMFSHRFSCMLSGYFGAPEIYLIECAWSFRWLLHQKRMKNLKNSQLNLKMSWPSIYGIYGGSKVQWVVSQTGKFPPKILPRYSIRSIWADRVISQKYSFDFELVWEAFLFGFGRIARFLRVKSAAQMLRLCWSRTWVKRSELTISSRA